MDIKKLKKHFNRIWNWCLDFFSFIASSISGALLTVLQFSFIEKKLPYPKIIITIVILINITSVIFSFFSKRRISHLDKDLKNTTDKNHILSENLKIVATNTENLFKGYLYSFYSLKIKSRSTYIDRLTIYIYDNKASRFVPCGRFSPSPIFAQTGRPSYPEKEGIIGKVWHEGWHCRSFTNEKEAREKSLSDYNLPRDTYRKLTMKSLFFAGIRITHDNIDYGLLMFESTDSNRYQEQEIKSLLTEQIPYLCNLIQGLRSYIPDLQEATEQGF